MNVKQFYFYFFGIFIISALIFRVIYINSVQAQNVYSLELANPVVLAYNEAQTNRSSAVHIGDGFFLTSTHILGKTQNELVLKTNLEQVMVANLLWSSNAYDISLLYVKDHDMMEVDSYSLNCSPLSVGDELTFIGNPQHLDFISSWGRVSSTHINVPNMWERVLPVNATIIPGMSGGAAINKKKELKGINVGTMTAIVGMTPLGPITSFTNISYIVESTDICLLMGKI